MHELWEEHEGWTFCLAGSMGDGTRSLLGPGAKLVWTVEAASHTEAMTLYYEHMEWGEYTQAFPDLDGEPYANRGWE